MESFKKKFLLVLITCIFIYGCDLIFGSDKSSGNERSKEVKDHAIEVMTYNIRGDNPDDVYQWNNRRDKVVELIKFYNPTVLGVQEAKPHQIAFLEKNLEDYSRFGGGDRTGEYNSILYKTKEMELLDHNTIWLSETPEERSIGWDAKYLRILSYGSFRHIQSDREMTIFYTHFDNVGEKAREESSKLALSTIEDVSPNEPVVLMGDFNLKEESEAYHILNSSEIGLRDAYYISELPNVGPDITKPEGFKVRGGQQGKRIDYIFVNNHFDVLKHSVLSIYYNGYYLSDHLPVVSEIAFD